MSIEETSVNEVARWYQSRTATRYTQELPPPNSYDLARQCVIAGLLLAAQSCVKVFAASNATYRQTRDQHDDGRSSGAEECEQAILALIPKEPSNEL